MSGKIGLFFLVQWAFWAISRHFHRDTIARHKQLLCAVFSMLEVFLSAWWNQTPPPPTQWKIPWNFRSNEVDEKNYLCLQVFIFISLFQRDTRDTIDDRQTLIQTTECSPERNWKNDFFSVKSVLFASHCCDCSVKWDFCQKLATCGKLASKQRVMMNENSKKSNQEWCFLDLLMACKAKAQKQLCE